MFGMGKHGGQFHPYSGSSLSLSAVACTFSLPFCGLVFVDLRFVSVLFFTYFTYLFCFLFFFFLDGQLLAIH